MKKELDNAITGEKNNAPILKRGSSMELSSSFWDLPGGKMEKSKFYKQQLKDRRKKKR
jgi:hypothetical protein